MFRSTIVIALVSACLLTASGVFAQNRRAMVSPELLEDGRVTFRYRAPNATLVQLQTQGSHEMVKDDNGVWSVTIGPLEPDLYEYAFMVDGQSVIDPSNTIIKPSVRPGTSMVEVNKPDPPFFAERPGPRGILHHHRYDSKAAGITRELIVYTPPGYNPAASRRYPVLYLFHGSGDTQGAWTATGRVNAIADNLINDKKATPMLIVMTFGHIQGPAANDQTAFRRDILGDVMPLIEREYKVQPDAAHRAICGLSMGGFQTIDIGFNNMDMFSHIGIFSSGMRGNTSLDPGTDLGEANGKLKLIWIGIGEDDFLMDSNNTLLETLDQNKARYTFVKTDGGHTWHNWRIYINRFLPLLFK